VPAITWVGLGFVLVGIYFMRREHTIILDSPKAEARIIELVKGQTSKTGAVEYIPKASFRTMEGAEIVFSMAATIKPGVKVGDPVRVAYNPANPNRVRILSFGYRFAFWYCIVGLGLLLLFIGGGLKLGNDWMQKAYLPTAVPAQH